MFVPIVFPGIKDANKAFGKVVGNVEVIAFVEIAGPAGKREVCLVVSSSPRGWYECSTSKGKLKMSSGA
jgi:hypothetical protein